MKFIAILTIVLLLASSFDALKVYRTEKNTLSRKVKIRRTRDTNKCEFVFAGKPSASPTPSVLLIAASTAVYPADIQNQTAKDNALSQTKAGRNFFYKVGKNAQPLLVSAATFLSKLIAANKDFWTNLKAIQRQENLTWYKISAKLTKLLPNSNFWLRMW